jgi:hypothetical protein
MTGSTTPMSEQPDWHPVHRANALLREALQNTTRSFESLEARYSVESLSDAIESVLQGPVRITYPMPLAVRLHHLSIEEKAIPGLEALMRPSKHAPGDPLAGFRHDGDDGLAAFEQDDGLTALPPEFSDDAEGCPDLDEFETLRADVPLDSEMGLRQVHMQTLMGEFHRRQRDASRLVGASIATAIVLTIGGVVLAVSLATPRPADAGQLDTERSTSITWQRPASGTAAGGVQPAVEAANRTAKGEPVSVPHDAGTSRPPVTAVSSASHILLAASGRQIAFGPLLPPSNARYLMIRGLPPEVMLSAGRQSGGGAWLVKGEHVPGLTLTVGRAAAGDHPVEVYILESGDGPQARRSFVLRIAPTARTFAPAGTPNLISAAAPAAAATPAVEEPTVPAETAVLRDRATRLLGEGDIAAARLLLLHLAERGDGEAAYDLARTFDREMLAELGAKGMDGDAARARGWYERASEDGNVKAAERLKVLASLSGTGPSD